MHIPASIKRHIGFQKGLLDNIGRSDAEVLMFEDRVLKIQTDSPAASNEHQMLRWLQGKLPVPAIIAEARDNGISYLLMDRLRGRYLCDDSILDDQEQLAALVADGLRRMWAVDIVGCPSDQRLEQKFRRIEAGLRAGTITTEQAAQPETYGHGGFASPAALFDWLVKNQPEEKAVLSHGDYCLPNVFADENGLTGLIDWGQAGIADLWVDIEQVLWSMWANTTGLFGGKQRAFDRKYLFAALNMEPDEEKLRYYSLLSELC